MALVHEGEIARKANGRKLQIIFQGICAAPVCAMLAIGAKICGSEEDYQNAKGGLKDCAEAILGRTIWPD